MPLQEGERLFIDAMRELNQQAIKLQAVENGEASEDSDEDRHYGRDNKSYIHPHEQAITAVLLAAQRVAQSDRTYDPSPLEWSILHNLHDHDGNLKRTASLSFDESMKDRKKIRIYNAASDSD